MIYGGIQLIRSQGGGGPSTANVCEPGEEGSCQCERSPINFRNAYPNLQKEKGIQKWAGIVVKSGKRSGAVRKVYLLIKRRAAKLHKSSITFWSKAVSHPKNKQMAAAVTQSVDIADLEITSVLL